MSTLADELLNDFEDSGSEGEDQNDGGLFPDADEVKSSLNGHATNISGAINGMELDGDEEEVDEDDAMEGISGAAEEAEDEEETKAKVEKMQLGGVDDVRSVAGLMMKLEPVLEVRTFLYFPLLHSLKTKGLHLFFRGLALTSPRPYRRLHIFNHCLPRSKQHSLAQLKIIPNTIF